MGKPLEVETNFPAGTLFDRVILSHTRENRVGHAYFPADEKLLELVDEFLVSADAGFSKSKELVQNLRNGHLNFPASDIFNPDVRNAALVYRALTAAGLKTNQLPEVQAGFRGILAHDVEISAEYIDAAKKFTRSLGSPD